MVMKLLHISCYMGCPNLPDMVVLALVLVAINLISHVHITPIKTKHIYVYATNK